MLGHMTPMPLMIAHAGGGINGHNYSNSLEALEYSYQQGFRYFEIDFSWTSDAQLVCLHDWDKQFQKVFGHKIKQPLSLKDFEQLNEESKTLHPCTEKTLAHWLNTHSDAWVITDVKHDNIKAIKHIIQSYPEIKSQLIPQFYQPHEYQILKDMGFNKLIWILYQYKDSDASVVEQAKNMQLLAISMRASQAKKKFARQLINNKQKIFVYTINDTEKLKKLVNKYHVSGIYTDFLSSS
jgi:glycerophosphoryl diester phosphodiesterase